MSYTAKHYVNIAGHTYTPGEIIDAIQDGKEKRLLKIGAVIDNGDNNTVPYDEYENASDSTDADSFDAGIEDDPETEDAEAADIDAMDDILPAGEEPTPEPENKPHRGGRRA